jgi:hypothetical protein
MADDAEDVTTGNANKEHYEFSSLASPREEESYFKDVKVRQPGTILSRKGVKLIRSDEKEMRSSDGVKVSSALTKSTYKDVRSEGTAYSTFLTAAPAQLSRVCDEHDVKPADSSMDQKMSKKVSRKSHHHKQVFKVKLDDNCDEADEENKDDHEVDDEHEETVECPVVQDILVGWGPSLKSHPGNQRMVAIVAVHRDRYKAANNQVQRKIVEELISEVQRGNARFLKVNDSATGWIKCSSKEVRGKSK